MIREQERKEERKETKMKKWISIMAALALCLAAAACACAEGRTISPNPVTLDLENLENRCVRTDVEYKEDNMMRLTLYEPERFAPEAIQNTQVGDVIITNGEEVAISSIEKDGPDYVFNKDTETEMLFCDGVRYFEHVMEGEEVPWVKVGTLEMDIPAYLPILVTKEPGSMEEMEKLEVRYGEELKTLLQNQEGEGFNSRNVDVVFDNGNKPSLMRRYGAPLP